jgi:hypothetical protein
VNAAQREGEAFGSIQVVDSMHATADINVAEDDRRRKKEGKLPREDGACWGGKRNR